jgi:hypothetical protein
VCLLSFPPSYAPSLYTLARYRTEGLGEGKPTVNYPDPGFQGNFIPAHGPAVAKLIEDRVEGRL